MDSWNMFNFLFSVSKTSRHLFSGRHHNSLSLISSHPFFFFADLTAPAAHLMSFTQYTKVCLSNFIEYLYTD